MKSILPQFLSLCAALAVLGKTNSAQQDLLVGEDGMVRKDRVSGHNDAVYDIVPKEDQIWKIEFLEIAPTPIIADRAFFVYLGGYLPESKKKELALPDEGLVNATLTVSLSAVYADGSYADETSYTVPLKTTPFGDLAHLGIRDSRGVQVEYMPSSDDGDILVDFQILHIGVFEERWEAPLNIDEYHAT
ncbi:uncharacterized protein N7515_006694 [Penicillium bovifimosum]|uniref:Uncharacterized protein n=1 Tax=Penicillium bovifimosum TaxID=126998 RepID=A0A9W9L1D2_9EURO|nr:uncharacterized protein N7515_006694 [Penicillium bovifimosum]KAJ5130655.1 hypothetical protein N7515_006694 [Penicillium bovifimosum]